MGVLGHGGDWGMLGCLGGHGLNLGVLGLLECLGSLGGHRGDLGHWEELWFGGA